jgi:hypothetical protein
MYWIRVREMSEAKAIPYRTHIEVVVTAGRRRAVEHFDVRMTARHMERVFRRLTGGRT